MKIIHFRYRVQALRICANCLEMWTAPQSSYWDEGVVRWVAAVEVADPWLTKQELLPLFSGHLFLLLSGSPAFILSVDALWYEVAGRRGTEAFPLQVPPLPFFFPLFCAIILFYLALFCPSGPFYRQVHVLYTHMCCAGCLTLNTHVSLQRTLRYVFLET